MPDEILITEIENMLAEIVRLGGENERSQMVPNLTVQNANPSGLDGFVIVSDNRDGDNILAKKVGSVIYTNNDLVNVIFPKGGEAIAFQQGSQSANSGIWEIVPSTTTDIFYDKGDVGIGKSIAPDAALEILDNSQSQLRLTFEEDVKFTTFDVDTNHHITINPSSTGQIKLASADVTIEEDLLHEGDEDNKISFTDDKQTFTVGSIAMLTLTEASQDLINLGPGSGDVDINFNGDMFMRGSDGRFGIGTASPGTKFHVLDTVSLVARFEANSATAFSGFQNQADDSAKQLNAQMFGGSFAGTQFGVTRADTASLFSDGCLLTFGTKTSFDLVIGTNNIEAMRIDTSQNVGIGTTSPSTRLDIDAGAMEFAEMTAPAAGAANTARLFAQDNGAGKTQLAVRFNTGAIQILATEP